MEEYTIEQAGKPDLVFTGEVIGQSAGSAPRLKIYRTKAAKFVVEIRVDSQRANAGHFDKPADLVAWVRNDLGTITEEVQVAIEQATKNDAAFKSYWTEHVD